MQTIIAIVGTINPLHCEHYEVWEIPENLGKRTGILRKELHDSGYLLFSFTPDSGLTIDETNPGVVVFEEGKEGYLTKIE